jgi:HD-GYP domain-containing protein (c-di-GMP phosphodiesterase class II)
MKWGAFETAEEVFMTYATSHQTWGHRTIESPYRSSGISRASRPLHEVIKNGKTKQSDPEVFLTWMLDLEDRCSESPGAGKREETYKAFIKDVSFLTQSRDPYTAGHQWKVSEIARGIAREMGLSADTIEGIRVAGMVHDMGKLSVPAEIVTKPGALTSFEFSIIKEHPTRAFDVLKEIDFPWPVAETVRQHHERLDGSGYPAGLKGDEIRMEARVLAVADVVGAISSHRPYRRDLGIEAALKEIDKKKGLLYDTEVTRACRRSLKGSHLFIAHRL